MIGTKEMNGTVDWFYRSRLGICLTISTALMLASTEVLAEDLICVAVYDHSTGTAKAPKALRRVLGDETTFVIKKVTPEDIRQGALDEGVDLLIMPGGSGSLQSKKLEETGREKVKEFVRNGGGYIGICAGSYLASSFYDWSLHLINADVVDREHWARGTGQVDLALTPAGRALLMNSTPEVEVYYGQGPLLAPGSSTELPPYETLAEYAGEIAKKGAPTGVMIGTTAIARAEYGKGRVVCFSPHCEVTGGPNFMVVNAVLWATKNEDREIPSRLESVTVVESESTPQVQPKPELIGAEK